MPIYEYRCESCGHTLDALQKISDDPLKDCPECVAGALKRLISAPAFRLKGGGWYETDFKSDKDKKRNLAGDKEATSDSAKSGDGKDKAKSETAGEAKKADATPKSASASSSNGKGSASSSNGKGEAA